MADFSNMDNPMPIGTGCNNPTMHQLLDEGIGSSELFIERLDIYSSEQTLENYYIMMLIIWLEDGSCSNGEDRCARRDVEK